MFICYLPSNVELACYDMHMYKFPLDHQYLLKKQFAMLG